MSESRRIEVAVGVVQRGGKVLVGQRTVQDRYFQKWEFPGGKLEVGETAELALYRELKEELAIEVSQSRSLISLTHDYPDRLVRLSVFLVTDFDGEPTGVEGQALQWVDASKCLELDFLDANQPIIDAIQLPSLYVISNIQQYGLDKTLAVLDGLEQEYDSHFAFQLREPDKTDEELSEILSQIREVTKSQFIFLNGAPEKAKDLGFDGVQLNRHRLIDYTNSSKEIDSTLWIGASCHNIEELKLAEKIANFVQLSPVMPTSSHPKSDSLGWKEFAKLSELVRLPCYALGGMIESDIEQSFSQGAQGISAISSIWNR